MKVVIGQVMSGVYWNKSFGRYPSNHIKHGSFGPVKSKPFSDGVVIGFTKAGGPIIQVKSGNLTFKVYRFKVNDVPYLDMIKGTL